VIFLLQRGVCLAAAAVAAVVVAVTEMAAAIVDIWVWAWVWDVEVLVFMVAMDFTDMVDNMLVAAESMDKLVNPR